MGTSTSLEIEGDQSGAVDLVTIAAAAITDDGFNGPGIANNTLLANGGFYAVNTVNTAIDISSTGTTDTMTHVDVILTYVLVRA